MSDCDIDQHVEAYLARADLAAEQVRSATAELATAEEALADALAARLIVQTVAADTQQAATAGIVDIVNTCLAAVFDQPYQFAIEIVEKRGKTEAILQFIRNGEKINPMDAAGGGVIDVAAFALRVAAIKLGRPTPRAILIADEPFRFVSKHYRPRLAGMLEMLADRVGM